MNRRNALSKYLITFQDNLKFKFGVASVTI
jgi:hypothetical protein